MDKKNARGGSRDPRRGTKPTEGGTPKNKNIPEKGTLEYKAYMAAKKENDFQRRKRYGALTPEEIEKYESENDVPLWKAYPDFYAKKRTRKDRFWHGVLQVFLVCCIIIGIIGVVGIGAVAAYVYSYTDEELVDMLGNQDLSMSSVIYVLDENGSRIPDGKGDYVFNAVPTTDWGSAETLEFWREQWAAICNSKFEEKGLDVRIDHRSYERQGIELLPTRHEGPTVRAMEKKGIKTEKGEFNRWIRRTNAFIRNLRKNLSALLEAIKEIKAELDKPQSDPVIIPLQRYFDMRNAKAYSQKAKVSNLKELNEMANYLKASEIYTIEDLKSRVSTLRDTVDDLKATMDMETARMKEMRKMPEYVAILPEGRGLPRRSLMRAAHSSASFSASVSSASGSGASSSSSLAFLSST